jgi:hypothetical protein
LQQTAITGLGDVEESLWRTTNSNASTALTDLRVSAQQGPLNASTLTMLRNLIWLEWKPWRSGALDHHHHDDDDNTTAMSSITTPATIPTEIGYLTRLQGLSMEGNGLSGAVPTQLAQLTSLITLDFCKFLSCVVLVVMVSLVQSNTDNNYYLGRISHSFTIFFGFPCW